MICLRYGPVIKLNEVVKSGDEVDYIKVSIVENPSKKIKGFLHWVDAGNSIDVEV
jgi:hypothetical protein